MQSRLTPGSALALLVIALCLGAGCRSLVWQEVEQERIPPKVTVDGQEPTRELLEQVRAKRDGSESPGRLALESEQSSPVDSFSDLPAAVSETPPQSRPSPATTAEPPVLAEPPADDSAPVTPDLVTAASVIAASVTAAPVAAAAATAAPVTPVSYEAPAVPLGDRQPFGSGHSDGHSDDPGAGTPSVQAKSSVPPGDQPVAAGPVRQTKRIRLKGFSTDAAGRATAILQIDQSEIVVATVGRTFILEGKGTGTLDGQRGAKDNGMPDDDRGDRTLVVERVTAQFVDFRDQATSEVIRSR